MNIFVSLAVSLALTLILELLFALLWGVKRHDLPLVALVNVLTNPVVVLCYAVTGICFPGLLLPVTLALEVGAVLVEGWLLSTRSDIRLPWLFAVCVNLFSFTVGSLL